jgi:hypothetical protein
LAGLFSFEVSLPDNISKKNESDCHAPMAAADNEDITMIFHHQLWICQPGDQYWNKFTLLKLL